MAPLRKSNFNNNTSDNNTFIGLIFEDGVILGAPAPSTEEQELIHRMADNIYSAGATELVAGRISSWLELHAFYTKSRDRKPRVVTALKLLKSYLFSQVKTELFLLGGIDAKGPKLCVVNTDGSTDGTLPFAAVGSGRIAAKDVLKSEYRDGMSRDEGVKLVIKAIGSSDVDLCVMTRWEETEYMRNQHST